MALATHSLTGLLKLLSDGTRLRILGLIEREELSVGELSRALEMAQSRVSNHLRLLRENGLLAERHAGTSVYLRLAPFQGSNGHGSNGSGFAGRLWSTLRAELDSLPEHAADLVRLEAVLAERRGSGEEFFDRLSGDWDKIAVHFETGQARERAVSHLLPSEFTVADLGCGTGYMAAARLGRCARLICVDSSQGMLEQAQQRLGRAPRHTRVEFRRGRLDQLPIEDGELDGVVAGMVLHHLPELDRPLEEMARALRPGGTAVVLELAPHREAWMRAEMGDRHLGLESADVVAAFRRAGFEDVAVDPVRDRYRPRRAEDQEGEPTAALSLYVVRGRRPLQAHAARAQS